MAEPHEARLDSPFTTTLGTGAAPDAHGAFADVGDDTSAFSFQIGPPRASARPAAAAAPAAPSAEPRDEPGPERDAASFRIGGPPPIAARAHADGGDADAAREPRARLGAVRRRGGGASTEPRSPHLSLRPAYFLITFLAGVVFHQIALNHALGFGLREPPVTELRVPAPYPVRARAAPPPPATPQRHVALATSGDARTTGFRVSALTSEVDAANGLVFWTGRVTNTSPTAVDAARMTLEARDASGNVVGTDTALLQPSRLAAGDSAMMQLRVPDDPAIARWALRAEWLQPTRQELLDSESRPGRVATTVGD